MLVLHPELKPYQRHSLKVSELHELYIDEAGNPDAYLYSLFTVAPVAAVMAAPVASMTRRSIASLLSISAAVADLLPMASCQTIPRKT